MPYKQDSTTTTLYERGGSVEPSATRFACPKSAGESAVVQLRIEKSSPQRHLDAKDQKAFFVQLGDLVPLWQDEIRNLNTPMHDYRCEVTKPRVLP